MNELATWTTIPDKAARWGDGPWVDEPDKAQWVDEATGLVCLALRHRHWGQWCGYVGVPAGHPWHGVDADDDRVWACAHGYRVNYAAGCQEDDSPVEQRICHIPTPGEPDDVWWFGFDCGHAGDLSPFMKAALGAFGFPLDGMEYRTLEYVQVECSALAAQLAVAGVRKVAGDGSPS